MNISIKNTPWIGGAAVFFAAVLWAIDGVLRESLQSLDPLTVVFLEHLIGTLIIAPILFMFRSKIQPLTKKQKYMIVLVALLSGVLGTTLFVAALFEVFFANFSVVILLQQLQPIFAIITASILLKERLSPKFIGAAALAMLGAYMLNFPDGTVSFESQYTARAGLLAIGAAAAWGTSTAFSKYALKDTFWLQITALRFTLASIFSGIGILLIRSRNDMNIVTADNVRILIAVAFTTGLAAVALYYFGLQRIRASRATILELAFPLTAVVIGYVRFDNRLTVTQWVGAVIVVTVSYYLASNEPEMESY